MKNVKRDKQRRVMPSRLIVGIIGSVGCLLIILVRSSLSVAIIAMVDEQQVIYHNIQLQDTDLCFDANKKLNESDSKIVYNGKYSWNQWIQGIILGSYFYGYSVTQILGYFSDKFGAKWMVGLGVFLPALCNALIPVLADLHYSLVIVMRIMIGGFHGMVYSGLFSMISKWYPLSEQNLALTGIIVSSNLGGVISMPLAGYLCKTNFMEGWPSVFYLTSILHLIWFYFWYQFVYNSPEEDRYITQTELEYILVNNRHSKSVRDLPIPWRAILTSRPVWASIISKMCGAFGYYMLCANLPTYLDTVFGLELHTNSWFNSLMYAFFCLSSVSAGPLSNWIKNRNCISLTRNRKNFQSFGNFGCCLCMALVPSLGCNEVGAITLLLLGIFLFGSITGGEFAVIPEYAPNYSGTVFGVANTLASTTGFIGPQIVGYLLDYDDGTSVRHRWNIVWLNTAAIYAIGGIAFEVLGTAEPQSWAVVPKEPLDQEDTVLNELNI